MVNAVSQKRTGLYRSEECNIRLKEICDQRDCERIVILANQESIPANYRKGGAKPSSLYRVSYTCDVIIELQEIKGERTMTIILSRYSL